MLADYIRQYKKLPDVIKDRYIVEGPYDYPPILLVVLSFFPKRFLEEFQWLISPIFDLFHNLLLFATVYLVTENVVIAVVAQLIYALTPIVVLENSNLSTRSLGSLTLTLAFLPLLLYTVHENPLFLLVAIFFNILLFFTHRFSTQALLFTSVFFTFYELNPLYLGVFALSVICATLFSGGFYLRILRGHFLLLKLWFKNMDRRFAHQIRGVDKEIVQNPDFITRVYCLFWKVPIGAIIGSNPWVLFVWLFLLGSVRLPLNWFGAETSARLFSKLATWAIVAFVLAVATTWLKPLRFLGEGQRYLEAGAFPTAIIAGLVICRFVWARHHPLWIAFSLVFAGGCLAGILYIQKKAIIEDTNRTITPALWEVIKFLRWKKEEIRIACIPHTLADAIMYFTNSRVLCTDNSVGNWKLLDFFPVIKRAPSEIVKKYDLNYLLVNENYVKIDELKLPSAHVAFHTENLYLLKPSGE